MEFLFENPLLIFILIGIISSLFKKGKGEDQQDRRPTSRPTKAGRQEPMQTTGYEKDERPFTFDQNQPSERELVKDGVQMEAVSELPMTDMQKKYQEWKQASVQSDTIERRKVTRSNGNKETEPLEKVSVKLKPEPDRLIAGIAWAQIMGPPRAKNPHRTRRR